MSCSKPVQVWRSRDVNPSTGKRSMTPDYHKGIPGTDFPRPCGRCTSCLKKRSREWAIRGWAENRYHERSQFLTLTYESRYLPRLNGKRQLQFDDLTNFFKRYRFWLDKDVGIKIKYLNAGEYGTEKGRPHFHSIVWGHKFRDLTFHSYSQKSGKKIYTSEMCHYLWPFGNVLIGECNLQTVEYVAKYLSKADYAETSMREHYFKRGKVCPGIRSSNGLGLQYCQDFYQEIYTYGYISVDGFKYGIPRSYDLWLERTHPELYRKVKRARVQRGYKEAKANPDKAYDYVQLKYEEDYKDLMLRNSGKWIQ